MAKEKKAKGLLHTYRLYIIVPAGILLISLLLTIGLVLLYRFTEQQIVMIILIVFGGLTLIGYGIFYYRVSRRLTTTYYKQLFETTYQNINKIRNNDSNLLPYGKTDIKEIQMLDKVTGDIRTKLKSSYLLLKTPDYSNINLEYVDKSRNLITFKSFRENLGNIIFVSQSFRNVLVEVYFNLPKGSVLTKADKERLLKLYRDTFKEHEQTLFMFADDDRSLLIYIPVIDSFSEIKEKLNYVVTSSSIMVRDDRGISNILAQYAVVAYPYSDEDMILGDLRYAKRQNKPYLLFLPQRRKENIGKQLLVNTSMNLNYTSKIVTQLSHLDYSRGDNEHNDAVLREIFTAVKNFLDVDDAGIIAYDDTMNRYYSYIEAEGGTLFKNGVVSDDFIRTLGNVVDDDQSYYFSTRKHANKDLQQILGLYGICSGTYYVVHDFSTGKIVAIIYLFNRDRDLVLNSYLRETFFIVSLRIDNYLEKREIADYADSKHTENENILALTNMFSYHIDDDYNITYASKGLKRLFPEVEVGKKCYNAFFGLDKHCKDCPLVTKKKKYFDVKRNTYETSMTLADRKDNDHVVLIKLVEANEEKGDLFQEDFLTYSYKSLVSTISNEYAQSGRGYMLLLSIDNYADIVSKIGSEGYNYLVRDYVRNLKNKLLIDDIYYYNPSTLAIHFPYVGHKDIITKIESIYPLSKENYYNNKDFSTLSITYMPVNYPHGYAYPTDFLKHMSDFYHNPSYERNKDFIYFADFSISRSASKRAFMLSVLEQEFSTHNSTSMNLQPIVRIKDGHIFGAEILLRIADAHRNVFFNAEEISRIAQQENKTGLVTESIINFIGALYKEYGNSVFKINKFNRIAINIDQTYLDDKQLIKNIIKLTEENKLPNGFISMEIPEDLIPNNRDRIKEFAEELSKYKIMFSCDRYMGQYVDIDELAFLGFKEVKIARDIILAIDKDPVKYDALKKIVETSKKSNMYISAVGVENEQQLKMLRALDEDMMVQGYFLYKPLTRADLIAALISYDK